VRSSVSLYLALTLLASLSGLAKAERLVLVAGGAKSNAVRAAEAKLTLPFGVDFDAAGNIYFVELTGYRLRKIDANRLVTTVAGTGEKGDSGDGGPGLQARFNGMHSLAVGANSDLYLADTWNNRVRKVDLRTGMITAFAGTGVTGFSGDGGPALEAKLGGVYCAALDPKKERLYLADLDNRRIRVVNLATGIIDTVAGNGQRGVPRDGDDAKASPLVDPRAVAVDGKRNVYILERTGDALRVVEASGKIRTLIAKGIQHPGEQFTLKGPKHLCIDRGGSVVIADTENHRILRYDPGTRKITRVAGTGKAGTAGLGGDPLDAELNQPHGVFFNSAGQLYITDSTNNRILKLVN
jgi:sugar lactone lactonase YvrE